MASVITATNSSGLTQQADNSGVLQLASGTGNLVTIPSVTGTAMVSGNMPAFSAYANADQSVGAGVTAKVAFQAEVFDTNSNFDSTTNYRFTPTVAGYYQFSSGINFGITGRCAIYLYKNGSQYARFADINTQLFELSGSCLAYANGSTDYFEIYVYCGSSTTLSGGSTTTYFTGSMTRAA